MPAGYAPDPAGGDDDRGLIDRRDWIMRALSDVLKLPVLAVAAGAVMAATVPTYSAELQGRSVKIGGLVPLTGPGAEWGQSAQAGMDLAVDEINAAGGVGGVPIEVVYFDYQTREAEGIQGLNRFATREQVLAISGPCMSSVVEVIYPMLNRLHVPTISYCSAKPGIGALSDWGFRNSLTSDKQLGPVVNKWVHDYDIKTVVSIHDLEDAVSKAEGEIVIPNLLAEHGVEVLGFLTFRARDTDFSSQITQAKAMNPDGIVIGACYQAAAGIAKEARRQGMEQPIIGGACAGAPGYIALGGEDTEGSYMSTAAWLDDPSENVQTFMDKMRDRYGRDQFPYSAPRGYDNMYILKMCMEEYGVTNNPRELASDREKIKACLSELTDFPGVSGMTSFDEHGDAFGGIRVLKVEGGRYVDIAD